MRTNEEAHALAASAEYLADCAELARNQPIKAMARVASAFCDGGVIHRDHTILFSAVMSLCDGLAKSQARKEAAAKGKVARAKKKASKM